MDDSTEPASALPPKEFAPLDVLGCFERSFALFRRQPGLLLAAAVIGGLLPLVGLLNPWVAYGYQLVLAGAISASVTVIYLKRIRNTDTSLGDLWLGLREQPARLISASLVLGSLEILSSLPLAQYLQDPQSMSVWFAVLGIVTSIYLGITYLFAFPLILDRGLGVWEALETSRRLTTPQFLRLFGMLVLSFLVMMLGVFALIIGVLIALPIVVGAIAYAYEDLVTAAE